MRLLLKKEDINLILCGLTVLVFFIFVLFNKTDKEKMYSDGYKITLGTIYEKGHRYRNGPCISYKITINDTLLYGLKNTGGDIYSKIDFEKLLNTKWPVVYSVKDPSVNEILIVDLDFRGYQLIKPDSLKWAWEK